MQENLQFLSRFELPFCVDILCVMSNVRVQHNFWTNPNMYSALSSWSKTQSNILGCWQVHELSIILFVYAKFSILKQFSSARSPTCYYGNKDEIPLIVKIHCCILYLFYLIPIRDHEIKTAAIPIAHSINYKSIIY